jgi:hypothetical protein
MSRRCEHVVVRLNVGILVFVDVRLLVHLARRPRRRPLVRVGHRRGQGPAVEDLDAAATSERASPSPRSCSVRASTIKLAPLIHEHDAARASEANPCAPLR